VPAAEHKSFDFDPNTGELVLSPTVEEMLALSPFNPVAATTPRKVGNGFFHLHRAVAVAAANSRARLRLPDVCGAMDDRLYACRLQPEPEPEPEPELALPAPPAARSPHNPELPPLPQAAQKLAAARQVVSLPIERPPVPAMTHSYSESKLITPSIHHTPQQSYSSRPEISQAKTPPYVEHSPAVTPHHSSVALRR
jgi:hypothetical protein